MTQATRWGVVALTLASVSTASFADDGVERGDHLFSFGLSYGEPSGGIQGRFALSAGPGVALRYAYALTPRLSLGGSLGRHQYDGDDYVPRDELGDPFVIFGDRSASVLSLGPLVRVTFNPEDRLRAFASFEATWNRLEVDETVTYRDSPARDIGFRESTGGAAVEAGGELSVSDAVLVRGTVEYGYVNLDREPELGYVALGLSAGMKF